MHACRAWLVLVTMNAPGLSRLDSHLMRSEFPQGAILFVSANKLLLNTPSIMMGDTFSRSSTDQHAGMECSAVTIVGLRCPEEGQGGGRATSLSVGSFVVRVLYTCYWRCDGSGRLLLEECCDLVVSALCYRLAGFGCFV